MDHSEDTFGLVYAWPILSSGHEWFLKMSLDWFLGTHPPPMDVPTTVYSTIVLNDGVYWWPKRGCDPYDMQIKIANMTIDKP